MKPPVGDFSKASLIFAEISDLPDAFLEAIDPNTGPNIDGVSATDLVLAARLTREQAIRRRETGMFSDARDLAGISVSMLDGRITANEISVSPTEYSDLNHELVDTLMLQADLAASSGDDSTARNALKAAKRASLRSAPGERADLADQSRSVLQSLVENGSLLARVLARKDLKNLPESTQSLEAKLWALDRDIEDARIQWRWNEVPNWQVAMEWVQWGDPNSLEKARLLALFRTNPDSPSVIPISEERQRLMILYKCAALGNVEAAHDLLQNVKRLLAVDPLTSGYGWELGNALLAGLAIDDDDIVFNVFEIANDLALQYEYIDEDDYLVPWLDCILTAEPQIRAGERDPNKIEGLYKKAKRPEGREISLGSEYPIIRAGEARRISSPKY